MAQDAVDGVPVYDNGHDVAVAHGRNDAPDSCTSGQKWQCFEFVTRYL